MISDLYGGLLPVALGRLVGAPASHDASHVLRVVENATRLAEAERADVDVCRIAALLHELVNLPKDHPESHTSGDLCAIEAARVLGEHGASRAFVVSVSDAIRDHAFSKGALPTTLEGKILQDADRLDAIGAVGVARCMATAAEMRSRFYDPSDPFAASRALDDRKNALDHFAKKLFRIPERLHTATARTLAAPRVAFMRAFVDALAAECGFEPPWSFPTQ
ncbi:MAG: HD domain-containing protein [Myxococcales bacterium]|nr:HD domain-containing protein [Myxococcales bacterium]